MSVSLKLFPKKRLYNKQQPVIIDARGFICVVYLGFSLLLPLGLYIYIHAYINDQHGHWLVPKLAGDLSRDISRPPVSRKKLQKIRPPTLNNLRDLMVRIVQGRKNKENKAKRNVDKIRFP